MTKVRLPSLYDLDKVKSSRALPSPWLRYKHPDI